MEFLNKEPALKRLHEVPRALLKAFFSAAVAYVSHMRSFIDYEFFYAQSMITGCLLSSKELRLALEGFLYVVNWVYKNNRMNSGRFTVGSILSTHTLLAAEMIDEIDAEYDIVKGEVTANEVLFGYQLIDVDWKAMVSPSSDNCSSLRYKYLTLFLTLANPQTGEIVRNSLILKPREYEGLLKECRRISSIFNTYESCGPTVSKGESPSS